MLALDTRKNVDNIKKLADEFMELCTDFFRKNDVDASIAYAFATGLVNTLFSAAVIEIALSKMTEGLEEFMKKNDKKEVH